VPPSLDDLLTELQRQPLERPLDGVTAEVNAQLAERTAANAQAWRLRAAAVLLVAVGGAIAGTSTAAVAAPKQLSPFESWSSLAPSTLLEPAG
jgi:hypothetical protein